MNGIIAFCGAKGSGKSTSAEILQRLINNEAEELAFAGHLKESCSLAFNVDMKYFLDPKLKEVELDTYVVLGRENLSKLMDLFEVQYDYDKHVRPHMGRVFQTGRSLLQYIGTDVLHPIDSLIHVNITLKKKDPNKLSIVTDLRFPQEFEALEQRSDFTPIYVNNTHAENAASADTHASEQGWKKFKDRCLKLDNNSDLGSLESQLKHLLGS